jgi:hypothetical protein
MNIRIRATGQVLLDHEWVKWVAKTYGRSVGPLSTEAIEMFDSDPVFEGPQATGGTVYQYSMRQGVEQQADGKWYTKYVLGPIFTDTTAEDGTVTTAAEHETAYKAMKDAEQAKSVREDRTRRLQDCDWTQLADSPVDKTVWATYRQALRDITTQTGFPWAINWPTQPE